MRIIHLSTYDQRHGAARAACRIHKSLQDQGVDSQMFVQYKSGDDETVTAAGCGVKGQVMARLSEKLDHFPLRVYPRRASTTWSVGWNINHATTLSQRVCKTADLINLHWIGDGFVGLRALPRLRKPILWTLHDAWAFTGGCHYFGSCLGYEKSCGRCPQLGSRTEWDLSRLIWYWKKREWESLNLAIVSPSRWLGECAASSSLFSDCRIEVIPYGLDLRVFKPIEPSLARSLLNLPLDKKTIAMGALSATVDPRKGFEYVAQAARMLAAQGYGRNTELIVFGDSQTASRQDTGLPTTYLGLLHDETSLALAYSAADAFVAPSQQDNFCQTVLEALACGTPVVAFRVGGMPELIEHGRTGYLARPSDVDDLAKGISWVIDDQSRLRELSTNCRERVKANFSKEKTGRTYRSLCEGLLRAQ